VTYSSDSEPSAKKVADDPLWDLNPPNPLPVLIRATDGKSKPSREDKNKANKVKLSTVVQPNALEAFYTRYADVCKTGMSSLKKRDRKKDKAKKKKKKTGAEGEKKA
jgi:signal recognition particle subunit SRP14